MTCGIAIAREKPRSNHMGIALNNRPAIAKLATKLEPGLPVNRVAATLTGTSIRKTQIFTHVGKAKKLSQISEKNCIFIDTSNDKPCA